MLPGVFLAAVSLSVADASSATVRSTTVPRQAALDLATTPRAALAWNGERSSVEFGYSPTFAWLDVTRDDQFALSHRASATYSWWTRRVRLTLGVTGSLGRTSFLNLARATAADTTPTDASGQPGGATAPTTGTTATGVTFFPQQEIVYTGSLGVSLAASYLLSRRWALSMRIGYEVGGGLGDSEQFVPLHRGPSADAGAAYRLTHRDTLTTSVAAAQTLVPSRDSRFTTISVLEGISHRFALRTQGNVGVGGTILRSKQPPDEQAHNALLAAGVVGFSEGWLFDHDALVTFTAAGNLGTDYNPVLGVVNQRVSGNVGLNYSKGDASAGAFGQVSQTLPVSAVNAALVYGAGVTAGYNIADPLQVAVGAAWTHQVLPNEVVIANISPNAWRAFITLTLAAPALTL